MKGGNVEEKIKTGTKGNSVVGRKNVEMEERKGRRVRTGGREDEKDCHR